MIPLAVLPRRSVSPALTGLLLLATALLPMVAGPLGPHLNGQRGKAVDPGYVGTIPLGALVVVVLLAVLLAGVATVRALGNARRGGDGAGSTPASALRTLLLQVWPVGLLTVAYPLAATRMAGHAVGGVPLATFLLAASLTVPWLSQGVCMPLYRVLGELNGSNDHAAVRRRFCAAWPATFARALPLTVLTAVPLFLVLRWSLTAVVSFVVLVGLHLALVQGLVPTNVGRARGGWALAWTAYAVALLAAPSVWFLPPLVALLTQLVPLRRDLLVRPVWRVHHAERAVVADVMRGLLLGSVLWADKLFYFVRSDGAFPVTTVFLALLPAVLAYNYFFASMAPRIDAAVEALRSAMQEQTLTGLAVVSRAVAGRVSASVRRTALVGAALSLVAATILTATSPTTAALVAAVCVASWCFMMTTLLCYQLDYIGDRVGALGASAVHLVLAAAAFACLPAGAPAYAALAVAELALLALVLRRCLGAWSVPEYSFFWRRALSW